MELPEVERPDKPIKPQWVRTMDVFLLGPFLVWAGSRKSALPGWARLLLIASGVATSYYNQRNYLIYEKLRELSKQQ
jgi:hypothetical protein